MKITKACINDPTLFGTLELPTLVVEVTEFPDVTIPSETFGGGWRVGKRGPFVEYEGPGESDAGDFNIRFRGRFQPVVDIDLEVVGSNITYQDQFSLPLSRARQLVRKYESTWRLLINDKAASEHGALLWTPVETQPGCRYWRDGQVCLQRPARKIHVSGIDLPMCEVHVKTHNDRYASKRTGQRAS